MLHHYTVVALRNFRRAPLAVPVSVLMLALGLFCFVVAYTIDQYWARADLGFEHAGRTYVVSSTVSSAAGGPSPVSMAALSSPQLAEYLRADFPEIEAVARLAWLDRNLPVSTDGGAARVVSAAADPQFLEIFDLPFMAGNGRQALAQPGSVIMPRATALRLFGREDVVGEALRIGEVDATITAVFDAWPQPSHLGMAGIELIASRDVLDRLTSLRFGVDVAEMAEDWLTPSNLTYALLPADGSFTAAAFRARLPEFLVRRVPAEQIRTAGLELNVLPLGDVMSLMVNTAPFLQGTGLTLSALLYALGLLVLLVACANFANLSTARSVQRAREAGLRKAVGASRAQVTLQHLYEAGLLVVAALGIALAALALLQPAILAASGIDVGHAFRAPGAYAFLSVVVVAVTMVAGAYPATVLAGARPIDAIRGHVLPVGPKRFSALLTAAQFAVSSFLLIAVVVTLLQNRALERLGADHAGGSLLVVENQSEQSGVDDQTLAAELARLPDVVAATSMWPQPWSTNGVMMRVGRSPDDSGPAQAAQWHGVKQNFFAVFDIPLIAGRLFEPGRAEDDGGAGSDTVPVRSIVIDRAFSRELGFGSPGDAVGELVHVHSQQGTTSATGYDAAAPWRVIGVVEDRPLSFTSGFGGRASVYVYYPGWPLAFHVARVADGRTAGAASAVDALWRELTPDVPVARRFVAEYFEQGLSTFTLVNRVFTLLAVLASFIATAGFFAIASLIAVRRSHEIAIRKTLGAHTWAMVLLLLRGFAKPVLVGALLAWPLAWLVSRVYLNLFTHAVELTLWPFFATLAFMLGIAWLTVVGQTWNAARRKPALVLRSE